MSTISDFFARLFGRQRGSTKQLQCDSQCDSQRDDAAAVIDPATLQADWLVVGLGNPGARYAATRHNVGYMAADDLLADHGALFAPVVGHNLQAAAITLAGTEVVVLRAGTFMNLSGGPVAALARELAVPAERIIVIHDELDLPPNKLRLKLGGNENGHNGLKSLTEELGTRDYLRVRIGIGRPTGGTSIVDHVLGPVDAGAGFDAAIAGAAEAARLIVEAGLAKAQNVIHAR